jgi:hypothetical protein
VACVRVQYRQLAIANLCSWRSKFGTSLAELTRTSILNSHYKEVKWARKEQGLAACQILFVSRSAAKHYD